MAPNRTCGKAAKINSIQMLSQMARALHTEGHLAGLICLTLLTRAFSLVTTGLDMAVEVFVVVAVGAFRALDEAVSQVTILTTHSLTSISPKRDQVAMPLMGKVSLKQVNMALQRRLKKRFRQMTLQELHRKVADKTASNSTASPPLTV